MVASQLNLAGALELVIPVLFLFLPDCHPERSRENRRRSALLDSPPGSGHMKQSRDTGTQKSIDRMENASNRADMVEIHTLVEGKVPSKLAGSKNLRGGGKRENGRGGAKMEPPCGWDLATCDSRPNP